MSAYYYDDPVDDPGVKRKQPKAIFASVLILFAGGLFLNTTLAANINIGTGGKVEFGQGMTMTAACSGSTSLTVTPRSSFVNASGSGAFYFNSVTVSGIPSSCNGVDFRSLLMILRHQQHCLSLVKPRLLYPFGITVGTIKVEKVGLVQMSQVKPGLSLSVSQLQLH